MFDTFLAWFAPGHREAASEVLAHLVARIEALEAQIASTAPAATSEAPAAQ